MPLLTDLDGAVFQVPADTADPMYAKVQKVTPAEVTTGAIGGSGIFDKLMAGMRAQLKEEFDKNRITGAEYAQTFTALTQAALQSSIQFVLGRDAAFWASQGGQVQAISGRVDMETKRAGYATALFTLNNILPEQQKLASEQANVARAQTLDTRHDTAPVTGLIGQQKELYGEQVLSFRKDAQTKAAKLFSDAWITQKTVDEGLAPPTGFTNSVVDSVLSAIRTANDLD